MEMTTTEVIAALEKRGVVASRRQILYAIREGHVPRPRKNSGELYCFTEADVASLAKHFKQVEKRK